MLDIRNALPGPAEHGVSVAVFCHRTLYIERSDSSSGDGSALPWRLSRLGNERNSFKQIRRPTVCTSR